MLVDQQHVGGFADALVDEEFGGLRVKLDGAGKAFLAAFDEAVEILTRSHFGFRLGHQCRFRRKDGAECLARNADHLGLDRRLDRGVARVAGDDRHFADIGTGGQIAQEHRFAADLLFDNHRPLADDEDVVAGLAFGDDRLACGDGNHLGLLDRTGDIGRGQPGTENLHQLPFEADAGDRAVGGRRGLHQLQRGTARHFDEDRVGCRADRCATTAARDQADFTEDGAGRDRHGLAAVSGVDFDKHAAIRDGEQRRTRIVALEHDIARAIGANA